MKHNKVAVLIPTYNREELITQTLESIDKQTYKNIDIYIYDDCSTDKTIEVVQNFKTDKKIFIKKGEVNGGCGTARNQLLDWVSREYDYYFFQDSDDISVETRFEVMIGYMESGGYDIAWSDMYSFVHPNLNRRALRHVDVSRYQSREGLFQNMNFPTCVFNPEIADKFKFNDGTRIGEDVEWICKMIGKVKMGSFNHPLYYLRKHEGRVTNSKWNK